MKLLIILFMAVPFLATAATTYTVDTVSSKVEWKGAKKVGGAHNGTVSLSSGRINFEDNKPISGEVVLDMTSINNLDLAQKEGMKKKLEGHLKSKDFFDVSEHPTSKFTIKTVKPLGENKYAFTGDLEIRGEKQTKTIEAVVNVEGKQATAKGAVDIDRTKYGVVYKSGKDVGFFAKLLGTGKDKIINHDFNIKLDIIATAE